MRQGYISLLAMAFALGLAILGVTLTAALSNHVRSSALQERRLRADLALESATAAALAMLAAGQALPETIEGVTLEISNPLSKVDPSMDPVELLQDALGDLAATQSLNDLAEADGLVAASEQLGLSAAQEDCLRRGLTYGRAPAARFDEAVGVSGRAGEQVDVRARIVVGGLDEVLWTRARFTGDERGWLLHDHRRLSGRMRCP